VQISETGELASVVDAVVSAHPDAVESYRAGEHKAIGFLVGQVMRETGGRADPKAVNDMLREALSGR
jgi:aspartyl-tRNA(Asn)/glutamyl-tRNA(Gln) amidotransferase subunit B